ncbi:helix-turn-helix transcriptional regulator [Aeromonas dhakensis]|uniref:helix-turn-helix transcriptional regulator n=1 Tax=Aeromonas dhakensis TaxID=196024 RepID=UPI002B496253|nr:helix-turn-helix transcriptional regulator [Aeromonas dhakensis]
MRKRTKVARAYVMRAKATTKSVLQRHGLTNSAAGKLIDVAPSTIGRWLDDQNRGFFDLEHAAAICIYLGIPVSHLLPPGDWLIDNHQSPQRDQLMALTESEVDWLLAVRAGALECYG